jgi:Mg2+ and Co2+ transporter CorA
MSGQSGEYNQRQYALMLRRIDQYRKEVITLGQLINDLEALNAALRTTSGSWTAKFEPAWGRLEEVYASMQSEGRSQLDEVDSKLIEQSLSELTSLIQSEVSKGEQGDR